MSFCAEYIGRIKEIWELTGIPDAEELHGDGLYHYLREPENRNVDSESIALAHALFYKWEEEYDKADHWFRRLPVAAGHGL